MRHHRSDVVERALVVLDTYGLADLTMRRLGAELGVQPSALYHHFANKQTLLAAVAEEILHRGRRSGRPTAWDERAVAVCLELREAMLAYRDGAEVVATVHAFGLGASAPYDELVAVLAEGGFDADLVRTAAGTLLHFIFGHVADEQTHLQAASAGAIDDPPRDRSDFELGLALVVDGIRLRRSETSEADARRVDSPRRGQAVLSRPGGDRMNKRLALAAGALVLSVAACSEQPTDDTGSGSGDTAETSGDQGSEEPGGSGSGVEDVGQPIALTDWGVSFSLPADIAVTEIRTLEDPEVETEALIIGSEVVAGSYDTSRCQGIRYEFGEVVSVFRFTEPTEGAREVNGAWYKVVEPLADEVCYDDALWEKYFDPSVLDTASQTLEAS